MADTASRGTLYFTVMANTAGPVARSNLLLWPTPQVRAIDWAADGTRIAVGFGGPAFAGICSGPV